MRSSRAHRTRGQSAMKQDHGVSSPFRRMRWVTLACIASVALFGGGCELLGLGGGGSTNQQKAQKKQKQGAQQQGGADQKQAQAAEQEEAEEEPESEYERPEYPGNTRRNPFLPDPEVMQPKQQVTDGEVRPLEPLEQYSISALELVAIISETAVPKAMFVDPDGFGHVVKEGDRIGRNGGQITDIRDNEVEVRETTDEDDSQTRLKTIELRTEQLQARDESGISDEEREALRRLLESDEGQRALDEVRRSNAPGANASEREGGGSESSDGRFGGIRPPTSQGQ